MIVNGSSSTSDTLSEIAKSVSSIVSNGGVSDTVNWGASFTGCTVITTSSVTVELPLVAEKIRLADPFALSRKVSSMPLTPFIFTTNRSSLLLV